MASDVQVELDDSFWAPRIVQLREHTLPVLLERLQQHGIVDNFRRLSTHPALPRRGPWFTDSDLYKWMEAAASAPRHDLLDPIIDAVVAAQHPDGYLHTFFGAGPGSPGRYEDLGTSHEWYCGGHLIEAAIAHHTTTTSTTLLEAATRWADHLCATFGPGRDERVDAHPEVELALARLAAHVGQERYLHFAIWAVEAQLSNAGLDIHTLDLAGHAVKALYLASAIAEIARATGAIPWVDATRRLFDTMVQHRSYPTGAVGGRWIDESVGQPYELPSATAYAESCAAVAAAQFSQRVWWLTRDQRGLDQIETLLFNAVPCGVGEDGQSWFYSQPHAVSHDAAETNPWVQPSEFQQRMLLAWSPPRRHEWFHVTCCPTNLARLFGTIPQYIAEVADSGDLLVHLPLSARIVGAGWDIEVSSEYPNGGSARMTINAAPPGATARLRTPVSADGCSDHVTWSGQPIPLSSEPTWWCTDERVEGASSTVHVRSGPMVLCVEGVDVPGVDLRLLSVDTSAPVEEAFWIDELDSAASLHRPYKGEPTIRRPIPVRMVPYHSWANRGVTTMQMRFRRF